MLTFGTCIYGQPPSKEVRQGILLLWPHSLVSSNLQGGVLVCLIQSQFLHSLDVIINSIPFHSQNCPRLDGKLHDNSTYMTFNGCQALF